MLLFRTANSYDLHAISQLLQATNLNNDGIEAYLGNFIILIINNKIIGAAGIENHFPYALKRAVAISHEHQHKQLGVKIINALLDKLHHQNFKAYYLLTETASVFFEKLSFITSSRENIPAAIKSINEFNPN